MINVCNIVNDTDDDGYDDDGYDDAAHLRKVDIAPLMLWCLPYELCSKLIAIIRMRDGGTLRDRLRVFALLPFTNPFIRIGITRLQKEATEGLGGLLILRIDDYRNLLTRMIALCTGHHLEGIRVRRLWSCLAMIGLIGPLLDARIRRCTIRKTHCTLQQQQQDEQQ